MTGDRPGKGAFNCGSVWPERKILDLRLLILCRHVFASPCLYTLGLKKGVPIPATCSSPGRRKSLHLKHKQQWDVVNNKWHPPMTCTARDKAQAGGAADEVQFPENGLQEGALARPDRPDDHRQGPRGQTPALPATNTKTCTPPPTPVPATPMHEMGRPSTPRT